jgi:hypothetical protein
MLLMLEQINLSGKVLDLFASPDRMVLISLQPAPDRWQRVSPTNLSDSRRFEGDLDPAFLRRLDHAGLSVVPFVPYTRSPHIFPLWRR